MKKAFVVVNNVNETQEEFEGKDLKIINRREEYVKMAPSDDAELLIVRDGGETIGVFRVWEYWKKIE